MFARRAIVLFKHWSAQPTRSAALLALAALLAFAGPLGCWLHCQAHMAGPAHGSAHAATLAPWAQASSAHPDHTTAAGEQHDTYSSCGGQHSDPSALTVGVVALLVLLALPRAGRRPPAALPARLLTWDRAPLHPPPRTAFDASPAS